MIKKTTKIFYLVTAISEFFVAFHFGTYVLFLLSHQLTLFEISLVNMVFMTTMFLFEVPTGAVADIFGRRFSYLLSCLVTAAGFLFYGFSSTLAGFMVAEAILALGATLTSGALDAWFVDSLKFYGYQGSFHNLFAHQAKILNGATILGALAGGYLGRLNLAYNWFVAGFGFLLVAWLASRIMKEEYFHPNGNGMRNVLSDFREVTGNSFQYVRKSKAFILLVLVGAGVSVAVMAPNMQWQPIFQQYFNDPALFGWLWAGMSVAVIIGNTLVPWLTRKLPGQKWVFALALLVIGVGVIVTPWASGMLVTLLFFLFHEMGRGVLRPSLDAYLNRTISSNWRATLLSIYSMATTGGAALGLLVSGYLAERFSIPLTWTLAGGLLLLLIPIALKLKGDKRD